MAGMEPIPVEAYSKLFQWDPQLARWLYELRQSAAFLTGLTASRLLALDSSGNIESTDLADWMVAGTLVSIVDNGDGKVTVSFTGDLTRPTYAYEQISAATTLDTTHYGVECTENTFTVTLPTAVGIEGRTYSIKNSGDGVITVEPDGIESIDGESSQTVYTDDNMVVISNGTGWVIV